MRRGFKTWAEEQASVYRRALSLRPEVRLPAARLAAHLEVVIIAPTAVPHMPQAMLHQLLRIDPESWSAVTIGEGKQAIIIHNTSHAACRQESNVMHELAHLICGHVPASIVQIEGFPFPLRTFDPVQEEEATWLGGCLHVPRAGLLWGLRRGMNETMLMQHFEASDDLIRFRRATTAADTQLKRERARR